MASIADTAGSSQYWKKNYIIFAWQQWDLFTGQDKSNKIWKDYINEEWITKKTHRQERSNTIRNGYLEAFDRDY